MPGRLPPEDLYNPDRQVEFLLGYLHAMDDSALNKRAVRRISEGLGLEVVIGGDSPTSDVKHFSTAALRAFSRAGQDRQQRLRLVQLAAAFVRELYNQIGAWDDNEKVPAHGTIAGAGMGAINRPPPSTTRM